MPQDDMAKLKDALNYLMGVQQLNSMIAGSALAWSLMKTGFPDEKGTLEAAQGLLDTWISQISEQVGKSLSPEEEKRFQKVFWEYSKVVQENVFERMKLFFELQRDRESGITEVVQENVFERMKLFFELQRDRESGIISKER